MILRLRTIDGPRDSAHPRVVIRGTDGPQYCGYSHCRGWCGLPALFLRWRGNEYKAHSSMVAVGNVWQLKEWDGPREYVGAEYDADEMINQLWW